MCGTVRHGLKYRKQWAAVNSQKGVDWSKTWVGTLPTAVMRKWKSGFFRKKKENRSKKKKTKMANGKQGLKNDRWEGRKTGKTYRTSACAGMSR